MHQPFVLDKNNSIAAPILSELRDVTVQQDRARFRFNLKRIGSLLGYELSKSLSFTEKEIQTPMVKTRAMHLSQQPILLTILRAGLPFQEGFSFYFDHANQGFIGAFRKEDGEDISVEMGYMAIPSLENQTLIVVDPMLATGSSLIKAINGLAAYGKPNSLHIACAIASQTGVNRIQKEIPNAKIWCGAIDPELDENSYIVPGLGDAGDLSFGPKT